nr:hypothetical protein [Tanacetum cinerariifolium]
MKWARETYWDENKGTSLVQEDAWEILRSHAKWYAPDPIYLAKGDIPGVGHEELFGEDARPRPLGPDKSTRPSKKQIRYHDEHRGNVDVTMLWCYGTFASYKLRPSTMQHPGK